MSNFIEQPPAFFDSNGVLRCWENADPLPSDWTGIAKRNETLFVIGKEGDEMSYTALQAKAMAAARDEISQRKLSKYIEPKPQVQYVIRSLSESNAELYCDAGAFWSNVDGWGSLQAATLFSTKERMSLNLPMSAKLDAEWMLVEEARDLEANRNLSNVTPQHLACISEFDAAIDSAADQGDDIFFAAVAAKDEYIDSHGIDRNQLEVTGREVSNYTDLTQDVLVGQKYESM